MKWFFSDSLQPVGIQSLQSEHAPLASPPCDTLGLGQIRRLNNTPMDAHKPVTPSSAVKFYEDAEAAQHWVLAYYDELVWIKRLVILAIGLSLIAIAMAALG